MKKMTKTNAARLLERAHVPFDLVAYEVDESDLSAEHLAATIGKDINRVFKTLVLKGDRTGHFVCVVPGNREVDLKKAAKASGNKKAEMIHMKDLLAVTGYIRGGCSPVGMKKPFPTFFHESCMNYNEIFVSAGMRGLQLKIAPHHLVDFVGAECVDLVAENQ